MFSKRLKLYSTVKMCFLIIAHKSRRRQHRKVWRTYGVKWATFALVQVSIFTMHHWLGSNQIKHKGVLFRYSPNLINHVRLKGGGGYQQAAKNDWKTAPVKQGNSLVLSPSMSFKSPSAVLAHSSSSTISSIRRRGRTSFIGAESSSPSPTSSTSVSFFFFCFR